MLKAVYAGSFDPLTNGHLDIIKRSLRLFDELVIIVAHNSHKTYLFSIEERVQLIKEVLNEHPQIRIIAQEEGLTVKAAKELGAHVLVRGIRSQLDFELEATLASHNQYQEPTIETVLLLTNERWRFVSSSMIKELAQSGGNIEEMVPKEVRQALENVMGKQKNQQVKLNYF